jgi:hypothetical protein
MWKGVKNLGGTLKRKTFGIISTILETIDELMLKKIGLYNVPFKKKTLSFFDRQSYKKEQQIRNSKKYRK